MLRNNWFLAGGLVGPPWYSFLIQFLFKIDANSSLSSLAPLVSFLIQFSFKIDANSSLGSLAPIVLISHSILIQNKCK